MSARRDPVAGLVAVGAGLLVALSLPPWGWWPLAPIGIAVLDRLLADRSRRSRFARGWLFGMGWLPLGMWLDVVPHRRPAGSSPASSTRPTRRWPAPSPPAGGGAGSACPPPSRWPRPSAGRFPFGGVPLASLAISQVAGPLAPVVRVGGVAPADLGRAAWSAWRCRPCRSGAWRPARRPGRRRRRRRSWSPPWRRAATPCATTRVTFVQGGGPQGTHAIDTDPRVVFERHLDATRADRSPAPPTSSCGPRT